MKRMFDVIVSFVLLVVMALPMAVIAVLVKMDSPGPVLYWSRRVGRGNKIFLMPKFRTMALGAPEVATHLLGDAEKHITPVGKCLRAASLDELPQLWSVLTGEMSLVGPRPALHNQEDLIALRTEKGIDVLRPGITGWAQINGRDDLPILQKAAYDEYYLHHRSLRLDAKILWRTLFKVIKKEGVAH
ncbi:MAG TPA: sugar transferase [Smithella sp.]|nr:sugar transferase [Smithella sp.]HRS97113.1 sugar transferase [Smithella sp.]